VTDRDRAAVPFKEARDDRARMGSSINDQHGWGVAF
jgi:hypothetical protein